MAQKKHRQVPCKVLRRYPRAGQTHNVDSVILVPEYAIEAAVEARPPFLQVLKGEGSGEGAFDATRGALEFAREHSLDITEMAGRGSGENGRIQKSDVERWVAAAEADDATEGGGS